MPKRLRAGTVHEPLFPELGDGIGERELLGYELGVDLAVEGADTEGTPDFTPR